jgi:hypothetical protein
MTPVDVLQIEVAERVYMGNDTEASRAFKDLGRAASENGWSASFYTDQVKGCQVISFTLPEGTRKQRFPFVPEPPPKIKVPDPKIPFPLTIKRIIKLQ